MLSIKIEVYILTDLKSCYDYQLLNLTSIIEELTSMERAPVKLFIKVLLRFKRYICTGFGISNRYFGRPNDQTGRIEQGIKLSEDTYNDKFYFTIK